MKRIHILLCVLLGMTVGITTLCSDEADEEYQQDDAEFQDNDDESSDEAVPEVAQPTPPVVVATPTAPAQPTPPVESKSVVAAVPTVPVESAQTAQAQDADDSQPEQDEAEDQPEDDASEQAPETAPADNQASQSQATNSATTTSTPNNQANTQQAQTTGAPANQNTQEIKLNNEPDKVSEQHATAAQLPADTTNSSDQATTLTTSTSNESPDLFAQQFALGAAPENQTTTAQQDTSAASNIAIAPTPTSMSISSEESSAASTPASSSFSSSVQSNDSDTIDIKSTDDESIVSSFGILPRPRKLSNLTMPSAPMEESSEPALSGPLTKKSIGQAIAQLAPLIMSRSVEKAVEQFTNLPAEKALAIMQQLIKTSKTDFTKQHKGRPFEVKRNDFLQILFGVASQYRDPAVYNQFFDLIEEYPGLHFGIRPILFVLSISSYPVLIPDLIAWLEKQGIKNSVSETGIYAIDRTSARSINALATYARSAAEPVLGSLLLYAISNKKPIKMVRALVDAGADANYADSSGYTPLIKAVEMSNARATKLLVEHGGDIDLIVNEEVGSAWQKSSELPKSTIMEYLQKNAPNHKPIKDVVF